MTWEAEDHVAPRNPTVERLSTALNRCQDINADLLAALEQAGLELEEAGKLISASTIGGQNMAGTGSLFSKASVKALAVVAKAKAGKG